MARYTVDPDRSTVTVLARPQTGASQGPLPASIAGEVELTDRGEVCGSVRITLVGADERHATVDLDGTSVDVMTGADGDPVIEGHADRAAAAFGLTGSPLLNPTVRMRWRLVLRPT